MPNINFTNLNDRLADAVNQVETEMQSELASFDPANSSAADLIKLQVGMQKWTIATQLQSNTLKTVGDGFKSTVQNIR